MRQGGVRAGLWRVWAALALVSVVAGAAPAQTGLFPWRRCESLSADDFRAKRVTVVAAQGNRLWIGTERGAGYTQDEGQTWYWVDLTRAGLAESSSRNVGDAGKPVAEGTMSLRRNMVTAMAVDGEDVWVGTLNGVCAARDQGRSWAAYGRPHGLGQAAVTALAALGGTVWVATTEGLFVSRDRGDKWEEVKTRLLMGPEGQPGFPAGLRWIELGEGRRGMSVWLAGYEAPARRGGGRELIRSEDGGVSWEAVATGAGGQAGDLVESYASSAHVFGKEVWACTRHGLAVSADFGDTWQTITTRNGLPSDQTLGACRQGGRYWVATADGLCWTGAGRQEWTVAESFRAPAHSMAAARTGVWLATRGGLLFRSHGGTWRSFCQREEALSVAATEGRRPAWWVGTPGGLCVSRDRGETWRAYTVSDRMPGNYTLAVEVDKQGAVWAATDGGLVTLPARGGRPVAHGRPEGLISNRVRDLCVDDEAVWVATDQGLGRYDLRQRSWRVYQPDLAWSRVAASGAEVYATTASWAARRPDQVSAPSRLGEYRPGETFLIRGKVEPPLVETWTHTPVTEHNGGPVYQLAARGGVAWMATGQGLFRSRDGGTSWALYGEETLWGGVVMQVFPAGHSEWGVFSHIRGFSPEFGSFCMTGDFGRRWRSLPDRPLGAVISARAAGEDLLCGTREGLWVREQFARDLRPGRPGWLGWLRLVYMQHADSRQDHLGYVSSVDPMAFHGPSLWLGSLGAGVWERGFPAADADVTVAAGAGRETSWQPYRRVPGERDRGAGPQDNDVTALFGGKRYLWVGGSLGLGAFDRVGTWLSWLPKEGELPAAPVTAVAEWEGEVWVGTALGLAAFSPGKQAWRRIDTSVAPWPSPSVTALAAAPGRLWVGTDKGGMALDTNGVWRPYLAGSRIYDAQAGRARVYLGTDAGLYGLDLNGEIREHRTQANSALASNAVYRALPVGRDVWALTQQGIRLVMRDAGEAETGQESPPPARGAESVVLVVNDNAPDSLRVAMKYVAARGTPVENICHLRCPTGEVVSRDQYEASIRKPLARFLLDTGLASRASYIVTTYGVPLRIAGRPAADAMMTDGASVDSELCLVGRDHALRGPLPNRYLYRDEPFGAARFGMFLVTRLDGPTAEAAMGLIDSAGLAEQAQTFGRRGFAYFDLSPEQNRVGGGGVDESILENLRWMERESQMRPRLKLESTDREMDEANECPAAFFYMGRGAGIYHKRTFTWLPGAVGIHIHALSARSLRRTDQSWMAAAVQDGLAAGIGTVAQPGSVGVNTMNALYRYLHAGYNWAESAYMSMRWVSWQTVVVGDPLYRPFQ